jgi:hypothetical protein
VKPEIKKRTLTRLCCEANTLHSEALEIKEKVLTGAKPAASQMFPTGLFPGNSAVPPSASAGALRAQ